MIINHNTTLTETLMVLIKDWQADVSNVGTKLPEFGAANPTGDFPSVGNCAGYGLRKAWTLGVRCASTWGYDVPLPRLSRIMF